MRTTILATTLALLTACGLQPIEGDKSDDSQVPETFGALTFSTTRVDFGNAEINEVVYRDLLISNAGESPVSFSGLDIEGSGQGSFGVLNSAITAIDPGGELLLELGFMATSPGTYEATLNVASDAPGAESVQVELIGVGGDEEVPTDDTGEPVNPDASITLSQSNINFGTVDIGQIGRSPVTIRNVGEASISLSNWEFSDTTFSWDRDFNLPYILQPGESKSATLVYTPRAETTNSGTATLVTNDSVQSRYTVNVSGQGHQGCIQCAPVLTVMQDWSTVSEVTFFFLRAIDGQSQSVQLQLANDGDQDLEITGFNINQDIRTGTSVGDGTYSYTGLSTPVTIAPGSNRELTLTYTCTDPVSENGCLDISNSTFDTNILHIYSNSNPYDYTVNLSGTAL